MSSSGKNLAFIVGNYKAGSTWLLLLLSLHPELRGVEETYIFKLASESPDVPSLVRKLLADVPWSRGGARRLLAYRAQAAITRLTQKGRAALSAEENPNRLLDLSLRDQRALKKRLLSCSGGPDACRAFFGFLEDRLQPPTYLVEKTPLHTPFVPFIREIFPDSKLITICRDGRDVVISGKFHLLRHGKDWSLREAALKWRQSMENHLEQQAKYDIHTLSYEGLHQDGPATVKRLLDFLGVESSDALIDDLLHRSSFEFRTGRKPGEENVSRFNRKGIVGDWVNHFSEEDKADFKEAANDMLVALGYERDADW